MRHKLKRHSVINVVCGHFSGLYSERNLPLLFTVAKNSGEAGVRSNCIIAMGDLAFRFPNLLEPWTEHMYSCLNDKCNCVRNNAVLVLSHLILNDMVKVMNFALFGYSLKFGVPFLSVVIAWFMQ
jgi:hypothetical protein